MPGLVEMRVTGHELREGIHDCDDRLSHLFPFHARRNPQGPGAGHPASLEGDAASKRMLHTLLTIKNPFQVSDWKGFGYHSLFAPIQSVSKDKDQDNKDEGEDAFHSGFKLLPETNLAI